MKRSTYTLRRLLALVLVLVMVGSLFAGCNRKKDDETEPNEETIEQTVAPTDEPTEAPTEAPTEVPTEPAVTEPPVIMGTVNADNLNVRAEPYSTSDILKRLAINTRIEILEQKIVDGVNWGRIAEGWVNLNYVTIDGEDGPPVIGNDNNLDNPPSTTPGVTNPGTSTTGVISAEELNIRQNPDADSASVGTYKKGDQVTILETNGTWGRTNKGWINMKYVDTTGTSSSGGSSGGSSSGGITTTVSDGNTAIHGYGTVTKTTSLHVRSGPGANYSAITFIRKGERHPFYQTSTNGWVRLEKGWVNADYLTLEYVVESGTEGTVNVTELSVRAQPDYNSTKLGTYKKGDKVTILETKGTWGQVEFEGQHGWVDLDKVTLPKPVSSNYSTGMATVTADYLHIREKASATSDALGTYKKGDKVEVTEVSGNWGKTADGWINLKYTKMDKTYTTGTGKVTASGLNVRALPDADSTDLGTLKKGTEVTILDTEGTWGKIEYKGGYGWISLNYVQMTSTSGSGTGTGSGSTSGTRYSVTVEVKAPGNGTAKASSTSATAGTTITITATPATGYVLGSVTVKDANGNPVTVSNNSTFVMPATNVTVTATFVAATPHAITIKPIAAADGALVTKVSGSTVTSATAGQKVYLVATPAPGKSLSSITVKKTGADDTVSVVNNSYFTMPAYDVTITATFDTTSAQLYSITPGTITPSDKAVITPSSSSAAAGSLVTLYIEPAAGYDLMSVTVLTDTNESVTVSGTGTTRTFTMPSSPVTYSAVLEPKQYKVNTSVTNGSVSVNISQCVVGSTVTVSTTVNTGCVLTGVKVYGPNNELVAESATGNFSFPMPAYNVTVTATIKKLNTITITTPTHGTVSASATSAISGTTVTLTATPAAGYKLKSLAVNGTAITISGNSGTFTMPDAAATVTATFEYVPVTYKVTNAGGANFRSSAVSDTTENIIDLLAVDTVLTSMEGSNDVWIKTTIGGKVGYVSRATLSPATP